jgi:PTS system galactitol-specific IIC component
MSIVQKIFEIGASALLPIMITILGLFFGMQFLKAFKSGMLVGIGFTGLQLVVGLLFQVITPAIEYYQGLGSGFTTVDIGWAAVGAASWAVPFAALVVPVALVLNALLVRFRVTKVMNVDVWNFVDFLTPGAMVYALTHSFWLGFATAIGASLLALWGGQKMAPAWQEYFGYEGTTCSTLSFNITTVAVAWVIDKIVCLIPGVKNSNLSMEAVNKKFGLVGDPIVIGVFVGALLGILTRQVWHGVIVMAVGIAAVIVLMPKMVSVMMEGLVPLSQSATLLLGFYMVMMDIIAPSATEMMTAMGVEVGGMITDASFTNPITLVVGLLRELF